MNKNILLVVARVECLDGTYYLVTRSLCLRQGALELMKPDRLLTLLSKNKVGKNQFEVVNASLVEKDGAQHIRVAKGIPTHNHNTRHNRYDFTAAQRFYWRIFKTNFEDYYLPMIENAFNIARASLRTKPPIDTRFLSDYPIDHQDYKKDVYSVSDDGRFSVHYTRDIPNPARERSYDRSLTEPSTYVTEPADFDNTAERRALMKKVEKHYARLSELLGGQRVQSIMQDCYKATSFENFPTSFLSKIVGDCGTVYTVLKSYAKKLSGERSVWAETILLTKAFFGNFVDRKAEHIHGLHKIFAQYMDVINSGFDAYEGGPLMLSFISTSPDLFVWMALRLNCDVYATSVYEEVLVEMLLREYKAERNWEGSVKIDGTGSEGALVRFMYKVDVLGRQGEKTLLGNLAHNTLRKE